MACSIVNINHKVSIVPFFNDTHNNCVILWSGNTISIRSGIIIKIVLRLRTMYACFGADYESIFHRREFSLAACTLICNQC